MTDKMEIEEALERLHDDCDTRGDITSVFNDDLRLILASHAALTERVAAQRSLLNKIHNFMCGSRSYETVFGAKARAALKDTQ